MVLQVPKVNFGVYGKKMLKNKFKTLLKKPKMGLVQKNV